MAKDENNGSNKEIDPRHRPRKLFEQAPAPYQSLDAEGNILKVNRAWLDELGYSRDEVVGNWFGDFLTEKSAQKFDNLFPRFKKEGEVHDAEFELERKDGTTLIARYSGRIIHDEDGNFLHTQCIFKNITRHKRREQALRRSKEKYKNLFQETPLGVVHYDNEGTIIDCNEKFIEGLGSSRDALIGLDMLNDLEDEELIREIQNSLNEGEGYYQGNYVSITGDKTTPVRIIFKGMRDQGGKIYGGIGIAEDLTGQKKVERELQEANRRLKRSRERYQKYFDKSGDAIFILKMGGENHGEILEANATAEEQTGYTQEELKGMNLLEDLSVEPPVEEDFDTIDEKIDGGKTVTFTEKKRRKDGSEYWTEVVVTPLQHEGKKANLSINRDITERVKAEDKLKQSEKKYRQIFHNANDAIYLHSVTEEGLPGDFLEVNDVACQMLDYSRDELLSMKPQDIVVGKKSQDLPGIMDELLAKGKRTFEMFHETRDGELIPVEISAHLFEMNGNRRILSLARDITDRKELKKKQKLMSSSLEQTALEIYWITPAGRFDYTNQEARDRLGYSEDELESMYVWDVDPNPEHSEGTRKARWNSLKEKEVLQFESQHKTKDGATYPVEITSHYVEYEDEEYEFAFAKDITERKESEKRLRQSEEKLRRSFIELAETTSRVLGVRDPYTQRHELKVGELAKEVGQRMELEEERQLGLYLGGVLHDIGKIAVPETILTKPGDLKDVEWRMIKSHPRVGYNQILEDTDFPWPVAEMTLHHHERLDGSGYPDGLEGDELTKEVRILGAVDVVEAMSTRRPYRAARSKERTLKVIKEGKGNKFDPEVVEILVVMIEEGEIDFGGDDRRKE